MVALTNGYGLGRLSHFASCSCRLLVNEVRPSNPLCVTSSLSLYLRVSNQACASARKDLTFLFSVRPATRSNPCSGEIAAIASRCVRGSLLCRVVISSREMIDSSGLLKKCRGRSPGSARRNLTLWRKKLTIMVLSRVRSSFLSEKTSL